MDRFERTCCNHETFYTENLRIGFASHSLMDSVLKSAEDKHTFRRFMCSSMSKTTFVTIATEFPLSNMTLCMDRSSWQGIHLNCAVELWCNERGLRKSSYFHPHTHGPLWVSPAGQCWNDLCRSERGHEPMGCPSP